MLELELEVLYVLVEELWGLRGVVENAEARRSSGEGEE